VAKTGARRTGSHLGENPRVTVPELLPRIRETRSHHWRRKGRVKTNSEPRKVSQTPLGAVLYGKGDLRRMVESANGP
jgi:hypothetical protein